MKIEQILPVILIIIDAASAAVYAVKGNIGQAVYWAAAAMSCPMKKRHYATAHMSYLRRRNRHESKI